jgi:hypothetical protein
VTGICFESVVERVVPWHFELLISSEVGTVAWVWATTLPDPSLMVIWATGRGSTCRCRPWAPRGCRPLRSGRPPPPSCRSVHC